MQYYTFCRSYKRDKLVSNLDYLRRSTGGSWRSSYYVIWERTQKFSKKILLGRFEEYNPPGRINDRFFVTRNGYFGRAPVEAVERGQVVTVLGGAYAPYLLKKHEKHYQLVSHAYVERLMYMKSLPPS